MKRCISKHPLYFHWRNLRSRCYNPKNKGYADYGARGITVCEEWKDDALQCVTDLENLVGYIGTEIGRKGSLTLDRIDNSKGYSPTNCRWDTRTAQQYNRRTQANNKSGVRGVSWYGARNQWVVNTQIAVGKQKEVIRTKDFDKACAVNEAVRFVRKVFGIEDVLPFIEAHKAERWQYVG